MKKILITLLMCFMLLGMNTPLDVFAATSKVWTYEDATGTIQQATGYWSDIQVDATATGAKFDKRNDDIQINVDTKLSIPVEYHQGGAEIILQLSGGSAQVSVFDQTYTSANSQIIIPLSASQTEEKFVELTFKNQAYISSLSLTYLEAYPGVPENVVANDKDYTFTDQTLTIEGTKGQYDDLLVNATNGKFAVQATQSRVQINAGTVLYIPVTTDEKGVSLLISGVSGQSQSTVINIDNTAYHTNEKVSLDVNETSYVEVFFTEQTYVTLISVDYASDLGYGTPDVTATDTVWDLASDDLQKRPLIQGIKGEYAGIQVDASTGKFAPRNSDTQVTASTILYIPVAQDEEIAVSVNGNNYDNLTVKWDGQDITVGKEFVITNEETRYIPLTFDGTGSCYLENIRIDYKSDDQSVSHTVRVGSSVDADYKTIQSALDHEISDAAHPLIVDIEPGIYEEKLDVSKSHVTLRALSNDPSDVVIKSGYYSSNTFDENGQFVPQDEYDVGTDQSGTIIVTSAANSFSMYNITVENNYNTEKKTQKDEQTPAVAFCSNADKVYLNNCRLIGRQDTLYVKGNGNRAYFDDCYIEGTVDFIFGDADAYFESCQLYMAYFNGKNNGYFTAPNTKKDGIGLVFSNCSLSADERVEDVSLGRPWQNECYTKTITENGMTYVTEYDPNQPNAQYDNVSSAAQFIGCTMSDQIQSERWNKWTRKHINGTTISVTYEDTVRFKEYNSVDEQGNLLDVANYDVVLGKMSVLENPDAYLEETLTSMRIGDGLGLWLPDLEEYHPEEPVVPEAPVTPEEPVIPENPIIPEIPVTPETPQIPEVSWKPEQDHVDVSQDEEMEENLELPSINSQTSSQNVVTNSSLSITETDNENAETTNAVTQVEEIIDEKDIPLASSIDDQTIATSMTEAKTESQIMIYVVSSIVVIGIIGGLFIFLKTRKKA